MSDTVVGILSVAALVFGFGFVIFWHELGHFLAAKAVGIKVEQFAVGFGPAIFAWRKGIGLRFGSTEPEMHQRLTAAASSEVGAEPKPAAGALGETEYRLNWVPLGGYVKMLGQDDSGPTPVTNDPRSFPNKSVSARMFVISAGVIMNVILAIAGSMVLFRTGHSVTPAVVGEVAPAGPAQLAGFQSGDRILAVNGRRVYDFNGVATNIALSRDGVAIPVEVEREGKKLSLTVTPRRPVPDSAAFVSIGIEPMRSLTGPSGRGQQLDPDVADASGKPDPQALARLMLPTLSAVLPGESVAAVNGQPVEASDYAAVRRVLDQSDGALVAVTVRTADGSRRTTLAQPTPPASFEGKSWTLGGMVPRLQVARVEGKGSDSARPRTAPAEGKIFPGDIVLGLSLNAPPYDTIAAYPLDAFRDAVNTAGQDGKSVIVRLKRGDAEIKTEPILPASMKAGSKTLYRLGIGFTDAIDDMTIGGVEKDSPAARAGVASGLRVVEVNGRKVGNWVAAGTAIRQAPAEVGGGRSVRLILASPDGAKTEVILPLKPQEAALAAAPPVLRLDLVTASEVRKTDSLVTAAGWGFASTRDFILQSYVTVLRMTQSSISPTNLQGPLGIVHTGGLIAWSKPPDWILWFVCMISANLAVVNFLPLPILDGGHFVLLCIEKLRGKPLSDRSMGLIQMTGLGLIACIFLFVTFNDITRLIG